jgi:flavin-binding protein dodecin
VENEVAPTSITQAAEEKLSRSRAALRELRYLSAAESEGGSGLCKAGKIIAHDYRVPPKIEFGFRDGERFVVEFSLSEALVDESRKGGEADV